MTTTLKTTILAGFYGEVILTEGMTDAAGNKIYGVFASDEDARSQDADKLALGTVGVDRLTAEQVNIARDNSEAL